MTEPGERVGRYIIDRRLGVGGMAEAFLAHQEGLAGFKKQVVLKVLLERHARDASRVELFLREARVGGRLSHANIIQIFDLCEEDGLHFIAMEYVDGLTLLQATKRCWALGQGIPIEVAVRVIASAAEGLHHAHTLKNADGSDGGIIHRDISPDNIMIAHDGTVKVLDFGVAAAGGAEATRSGDIKGKIPFMPPEQLDPKGPRTVDHRADLYALGVTLYWCLAARRPFSSDNPATLMHSIMNDSPAPLRKFNTAVSPELEAVVMNLLEKDREDRVASAHKLSVRLTKLLPLMQENPVAKFIARMRLFDDDPPEARPEAKLTGAWPAIVTPAEVTEGAVTHPGLLATAEPTVEPLPPMTIASADLEEVAALTSLTVSGPPSEVFTDGATDPATVVQAQGPAVPAPPLTDPSTVLLADVTVDENARLPGFLDDDARSTLAVAAHTLPAAQKSTPLSTVVLAGLVAVAVVIVLSVVIAWLVSS